MSFKFNHLPSKNSVIGTALRQWDLNRTAITRGEVSNIRLWGAQCSSFSVALEFKAACDLGKGGSWKTWKLKIAQLT